MNPTAHRAYVAADPTSEMPHAALFVVDTVARQVIKSIPLRDPSAGASGTSAHRVVVDPNRGNIYTTTSTGPGRPGTLWIIDATSEEVTGHVVLEQRPMGLVLGPDGLVYVGEDEIVVDGRGAGRAAVVVVDPDRGRVTRRVEGFARTLRDLAADRLGTVYVLASDDRDAFVFSLDVRAGKIARHAPLRGEVPVDMAVDANGRRLFIADQNNVRLEVIEPRTGASSSLPTIGMWPAGVELDDGESHLFVAVNSVPDGHGPTPRPAEVVVFDLSTRRTIGRVNVGIRPTSLAYDRVTGHIYVTDFLRPYLYVIGV